jgi:integrase/recombinase XerD
MNKPILQVKKEFIETQRFAKEMLFLTYLCHGANDEDLMKLKWKDISNNRIIFYRSKTSKATKNSRPIVVYTHDEVKAIIERLGNKDRKPDGFVFPVLNGLTTEKEMVRKIRDWRRHVNGCLNRMGKRIGFDFLLNLSAPRKDQKIPFSF